jgi:cell division protease FtsH
LDASLKVLLGGQELVTYDIIDEVAYSERLGEKKKKLSETEMRMTAYHEAGHLIAGYYGYPNYKVKKMEIAHRNGSLGITQEEVDEESYHVSREDVKGDIICFLGGRAAELYKFDTCGTGTESDLAGATGQAVSYVKYYGMDLEWGPIYLDDDVLPSATLNDQADEKVKSLINECDRIASTLIRQHSDKLEAVAEALIQKEVLYKEEILAILNSGESKKD